MSTKYKKCHPHKWSGVYYYELDEVYNGNKDRCFFINYKNGKRLVWEKVGKVSEGYSPEVASELRAQRVKALRHGEEVKTAKEIQREKVEKDQFFGEIAKIYFEIKGSSLKGYTTDFNRYEKHLVPLFARCRIRDITPQKIEELQKQMINHQPATLWNTLELLRRIVNFGHKTNRCPGLSFNIEMPKKDNEKVEYLKPDEVKRFLATLETWQAKDVANMLLLAFFTGMRRGEIFNLKLDDIDFQMNLIKIRSPKGGKTISIGLSTFAKNVVENQLIWKNDNFPESEYLFPGKTGGIRKDCSAVDRIKLAAKLPATFRPFHGLRHHFAVTLANSGKFTLDMISEMLTHKNVDFTKKKYGQFLPESMTLASNKAGEILSGINRTDC